MKRVLFPFLVLIFSSLQNTKAQVTYHFLHNEAVWGQFDGVIAFVNWQWVIIGGTHFQSSQGDTIIDSKPYIKIGDCDSLGNPSNLGYFFFIREDSLGKVWWYDEANDSDALLYDFNLIAGDTVKPVLLWGLDYCSIVVDSVSTVLILGSPRKAIYFKPEGGPCDGILGGYYLTQPLVWIEGIGGTGGLLYPDGGNMIPDSQSWLTCYRENGQLAFGDLCNIALGTSTQTFVNSSFEIFPNPFTTSTTITLSNYAAPFNVQLFDELGRIALLQYHNIQQSSNIVLVIDRGKLQSGMYFLSITSKEKREVVKLMVE